MINTISDWTRAFLILALTIIVAPRLQAQVQDPDMSHVNDVLGGQRTVLQVDEVFAIQEYVQGNFIVQGVEIPTARSIFSGRPVPFISLEGDPGWNPPVVPHVTSSAGQTGWMFNTTTQQLVTLCACAPNQWAVNLFGPGGEGDSTGFSIDTFNNHQPVAGYQKVLMGDFIGNGFDQALLIYGELGPGAGVLNLRAIVAAAQDPALPSTLQLKFGAPLDLQSFGVDEAPIAAAVGDFDGDGKKEIAVLMADARTIEYLTVDPVSLNLTVVASSTLGSAIRPAALAAGRFRSPANADLAVVGQVAGGAPGTTITLLPITPGGSAPGFTVGAPVAKFLPDPNDNTMVNVLAQAAPLQDWSSNIDQLFFTSNKTANSRNQTGHIVIGSFDANSAYTLQSDTDVTKGLPACIHSLAAGNFDNQDSSGNHIPNLSIATYWSSGEEGCSLSNNAHTLEVDLWAVNPTSANNWLGSSALAAVVTPRTGRTEAATMVVGDLEGRSLRLGIPEKTTITAHYQPDIVLAIPPMHVDWIDPVHSLTNEPGCQTPGTPCLLNLTVRPTAPAPATAFATRFNFQSTASNSASQKNTTSWSLGVKEALSLTVLWGVPKVDFFSLQVKQSFAYAHDHMVAKTYNTYASQTSQLSVTTGFADNLLYTSQRHNIYNYPVLGQFTCPDTNPDCTTSEKTQLYVSYSVPDQIMHYQLDATSLEWYQPVHEPGNVFSYPATFAQLQAEFPGAQPLTQNPAPVQATDQSSTTYTTTWSGSGSTQKTSGTVNSFSEGLGITATNTATDEGVFQHKESLSIDVNASQLYSSHHMSISTLAASEGIAVSKPSFNGDVVECCQYQFSGYILGTTPFADMFDKIPLTDSLGKPIDISASGPMFVAFTANPFPAGDTHAWWRLAYKLPDVGLNHPARWSWDGATGVSFQHFTAGTPVGQAFYQMKGFFITHAGDPPAGPNVAVATAGDLLDLSVRVYNFSPVATDDPSLEHPASTIFVTVWAQEFDTHTSLLVGDGVMVGNVQIRRIPGFDPSSSVPNWTLVRVATMDTTKYADKDLVFWTLVYMLDAQGKLVAEQPGHGLTSNPAGVALEQVIASQKGLLEPYSNNIGLYGTYSPLYIAAPTALGAPPTVTTGLATVTNIAVPTKKLISGQTVNISADLLTGDVAASPVSVLYFDGNPKKRGVLFGNQSIAYIRPDTTFASRASYTPSTCGKHTLFVVAQTSGGGSSVDKAKIHVECRKREREVEEEIEE